MKSFTNFFRRILITVMIMALVMKVSSAQEVDSLVNLNLEELMNITIVSASKKAERLFDSPLSAYVVTREDIIQSGALSIPEALRMVPGMIVRQQTNGIYDVHIRGLDNLPPNDMFSTASNNITLVMINNRIIYNYLDGSTIWETLPIDISDVDRIEVIRGAAAAMYGPNAAAGVINIITRKVEKESFASANINGGFPHTYTANGMVGLKKEKLSLAVSGNYQYRQRFNTDYYVFSLQKYVPMPATVYSFEEFRTKSTKGRVPYESRALDNLGTNTYFSYQFNDKVNLDITGGIQQSYSQKLYVDGGSLNFSASDNKTSYIDISSKIYGLTGKVAYLRGDFRNYGGEELPYTKVDADFDYDFNVGSLSIRPSLSYKKAEYEYSGFGKKDIMTSGGALRLDYNPVKYRLIVAARLDKYDALDKIYPSFQLAGLFKINENNLIRIAASTAHRSPFLFNLYTEMTAPINKAMPAMPPFVPRSIPGLSDMFVGNTDMELLSIQNAEIGFRSNLNDKLIFDLDIFYQFAKDYSLYYYDHTLAFKTAASLDSFVHVSKYKNVDMTATQIGATAIITFNPSPNMQIKAYGTVQQTKLKDYQYISQFDLNQASPTYFALFSMDPNKQNLTHEWTPSFYGGFSWFYRISKKFEADLSGYFMGEQIYDHKDYPQLDPKTFSKTGDLIFNETIDPTFILNLNVTYRLTNNISLSINCRNLLNSNKKEFGYAEPIGGLYLMGMHVDF